MFGELPVLSNTVLIITVCVKVANSTFLVTNKRTKCMSWVIEVLFIQLFCKVILDCWRLTVTWCIKCCIDSFLTPVLSLLSFTGNRNNIDIFLYNWRALLCSTWRDSNSSKASRVSSATAMLSLLCLVLNGFGTVYNAIKVLDNKTEFFLSVGKLPKRALYSLADITYTALIVSICYKPSSSVQLDTPLNQGAQR